MLTMLPHVFCFVFLFNVLWPKVGPAMAGPVLSALFRSGEVEAVIGYFRELCFHWVDCIYSLLNYYRSSLFSS